MCNCGKKPKRVQPTKPFLANQIKVKQLPLNFNWKIYKELHSNLNTNFQNEQHVIQHWHTHSNKNRIYSVNQITPDFNWEIYKELNPDLIYQNQIDYELHWVQIGRKEHRKYKFDK